jgi:hypothetical protein
MQSFFYFEIVNELIVRCNPYRITFPLNSELFEIKSIWWFDRFRVTKNGYLCMEYKSRYNLFT